MTKNYFNERELECHCGCHGQGVQPHALEALNKVREEVGVPFSPNSAWRCPNHSSESKKPKPGRHNEGIAFDIPCNGPFRVKLLRAALKHGFKGFGFYGPFLHIDLRPHQTSWVGS